MRSIATTVLLITICACGRKSAQKESVDTVMVFEAPSPPRDTARQRVLRDSLFAALAPYYKGRMSAEDAAKIIVDYQMRGAGPINISTDAKLLAAARREKERRKQ